MLKSHFKQSIWFILPLAPFSQRFNERQIFTAHPRLLRLHASRDFESNPFTVILAVGKYHDKNLLWLLHRTLFSTFFPLGQLSLLKHTKNNMMEHLSVYKFSNRHSLMYVQHIFLKLLQGIETFSWNIISSFLLSLIVFLLDCLSRDDQYPLQLKSAIWFHLYTAMPHILNNNNLQNCI